MSKSTSQDPRAILLQKELKRLAPKSNSIVSSILFGEYTTWQQVTTALGLLWNDVLQINYADVFEKDVTANNFQEFFTQYKKALEAEYSGEPDRLQYPDERSLTAVEVSADDDNARRNVLTEYLYAHSETIRKAQDIFLGIRFFPFQRRAIIDEGYELFINKRSANLLIAKTGIGKTFMTGMLARWMKETKWHEQGGKKRSFAVCPSLYVTRASIVVQTKRVMEGVFKLSTTRDIMVTNYDQLRSKKGERMIEQIEIVHKGEKVYQYKWVTPLKPVGLFLDECQSLKNTASLQSQVIQAYNDDYVNTCNLFGTELSTYSLFFSATPITRVADAMCIVVAMRIPIIDVMNRLKMK